MNGYTQAIGTYSNAAGIEAGYAFFAPNVPSSYKLVFELSYADGKTERTLPEVYGSAAGIRLSNLYDQIAPPEQKVIRELVLRTLAYAAWREHPKARNVRAVFGLVKLPPMQRANEEEDDLVLYSYDFAAPTQLP